MDNRYEAAEVMVIGDASETILGIKTLDIGDNRVDIDMFHRDEVQLFDE